MKKTTINKNGIIFSLAGILILLLVIGFERQPAAVESIEASDHHEDMGKMPWVLNIERATIDNTNYRIARWTGEYMQMVLMSLKPGEVIDLEVHEDHDQFIRIEQGVARILMGETEDDLSYDEKVSDDWAVFIPAGYWHQVRNTGSSDLKLYTIYAPSEHPAGIIHQTYKEAEEYHHEHHHDH